MAGVVAMASIIEDFDTQPCKKSRKDVGSPVVKTITNYFSPVSRPIDKPFSPPRSNNIMDYFNKKATLSKEKTIIPAQAKENCRRPSSAEKQSNLGVEKQATQKRGRKMSKAARKLVVAESVESTEEESCVIIEELCRSKDAGTVFGSDTEAPLSQSKGNCDEQMEKLDLHQTGESLNETSVSTSSPIVPSQEKSTCSQNVKKRLNEPTEPEAESSLCDVSMEVNLEEASQLNNSTVTISFEEFVRSQSKDSGEEDEQSKECNTAAITVVEEVDAEPLQSPKADNVNHAGSFLQVSPRTLTIQAEVHVVSPKQEVAIPVEKIAPIFNRKKGAHCPAEFVSSAQAEPPRSLKRKSNVVLQEEDLELAVIEGESTPKCSDVEKKQFMAAFKQPNIDVSKSKPVKSQTKAKQAEEMNISAVDDGVKEPSAEEGSQSLTNSKPQTEKKLTLKRKNRTKATKKQRESVPAPPEETDKTAAEADTKNNGPPSSPPTTSTLRRSRREILVNAPEESPNPSVRNTRRQNDSKHACDTPVAVSTPKTRKSKRDVFVAQMVCPPDDKESPIRMKLSRVQKGASQSKAKSESMKSPVTKPTPDDANKKKLVGKSKVVQTKTAGEEKGSLRRSTRSEASVKRSYCENEDSIICVDDDPAITPLKAPQRNKNQKALRSLNDVLGKATSSGKEAKSASESKVASLGPEKMSRKVSAVISIFDDSSREGSENSLDDEQFRARKEFLKSGLPESFRKQIAKTAAMKEAYSLSGSYFQRVTHTTQPPKNDGLWSLPWPESLKLTQLKEYWGGSPRPAPLVSGSLGVKTLPAVGTLIRRASGSRPEISEQHRHLLLEEVSTSNPEFPTQTVFSGFLKKRTEYQQQLAASDTEVASAAANTIVHTEPMCGKRKRSNDEVELLVKGAKKQRPTHSQLSSETLTQAGRSRRSRRSRSKEEATEPEATEPSPRAAPISPKEEVVVILDDVVSGKDAAKKDVMREDVLWTEKYQPQHSSDIVGNTASVKRLHSWLKEWKLRADREERKKQKEKKQEMASSDSEWDCADEDSGDDLLCNTMIITGPTGVGKTAAVYACAQELGFKVFEVNASSQRSGRLILSQLKEATQSHQVDSQGVNAHKPTYFNSYGMSSGGSSRPAYSPRKGVSPRRVGSSPRKNPQSPRAAKRGGLAPTALSNYFFKMGKPTNNKSPNEAKAEPSAAPKKATKESENKQKGSAMVRKTPSDEQSKKTATSLILFEEVDVVFEDDSGFLAAVKTFMTTTKRPVILTTSDPSFTSTFDGNFEEIHFDTPSVLNMASYLQLLCLAENTRTDLSDICALLRLNGCDIRQSLLQLQFWACSSGGQHQARQPEQTDGEAPEIAADKDVTFPSCESGCIKCKLGWLNMEPEKDIWELLKSESLLEERCWDLLSNSRQRGVDLLYCNMERLLPLPLSQLTTSNCKPELLPSASADPDVSPEEKLPSTCQQSDSLHSKTSLLKTSEAADCSDGCSPIKVSERMRNKKRQHRKPEQKGPQSDSDSDDGFVSLCKRRDAPQTGKEVTEASSSKRIQRKTLTHEDRAKSVPVSQSLLSIAEFYDNLSYIDSSLCLHNDWSDTNRDLSPISVVIKDGVTDDSRMEIQKLSWATKQSVFEIQGAVEALSFRKCRAAVGEAWESAQHLPGELCGEVTVELTLPVAAHREGYTFSQDGLCRPQLMLQRKALLDNLLVRGVFAPLSTRSTAALDYLPMIRTICKSEQLKEQGKVKRRFLHYLDTIHGGLNKSTLQLLAEDFP